MGGGQAPALQPWHRAGTWRAMKACDDTYDMTDPTELEWLRAAMAGGAFDDLADPREDIYTPEDGEPVVLDER
jgi:hypothetical protein